MNKKQIEEIGGYILNPDEQKLYDEDMVDKKTIKDTKPKESK